MGIEQKSVTAERDSRQERSLALQVQQALLQISQYAQIGTDSGEEIDIVARRTLDMVNCYLLGSQSEHQMQLQLESISLGSIAQDVLHHLTPTARQYGCKLQLKSAGSGHLIFADKQMTKAALVSLGHSLIEQAATSSDNGEIVLALRGKTETQTAGIFSPNVSVKARSLNQLRLLTGMASKQCAPFAGTGTGIALADALLQKMDKQLFVSRFQRASGFAVSFDQSKQLQIV